MSDRFGLLYDASFSHALVDHHEGLDFLEIIPDRFVAADWVGDVPDFLTSFTTVFHSLDLSIGSDDALDISYLKGIANLAKRFNPMWMSDHLAFTHVDGIYLGHLSPIRWSTTTIDNIAGKISQVQDELQMPFLIENIAYYFRIPGSDLTELEFLQRLVEKSGCGLLLDLNNVAVNAANHGFDPYNYLSEFSLSAVREIHIAGNEKREGMHIDSHGEPVDDLVWELLRFVSGRLSSVSVILERDQNIPEFDELMRELAVARKCITEGRHWSC